MRCNSVFTMHNLCVTRLCEKVLYCRSRNDRLVENQDMLMIDAVPSPSHLYVCLFKRARVCVLYIYVHSYALLA